MDDSAQRVLPAALLYRPSSHRDLVEVAAIFGCEVALPVHFHDEDQITFVVSGRRRFLIDDRLVEVSPGRAVFIGAGTLHRSLNEPEPVVCVNAYLPAGAAAGGLVTRLGGAAWNARETVLAAAMNAGMSREGYSRAFRRAHGVAPSVARALASLNHARRLLRAGTPPALAAAEAGFADQSHLGRCFRRAFGVTPGRYRSVWSHPFQTDPRCGA